MEATKPNPKNSYSHLLRVRLMEDAYLRAHARQLRPGLEAAQAAADQARREAGLLPRLLGAVTRSAASKRTPAETARIFTREKEARRQYQAVEQALHRYTEDLNTFITLLLQDTMPAFLEHSVARKRLGEWEKGVLALQADIRGLLKALGSARNSATSGYNKSKRTVSGTAQEQFNKAAELVRAVEARAKLVNEKAAELGGLPEVAGISCQAAIKNLPGLEFGAMQKEFDRLIKELETYEEAQLTGLVEPVVQAAALREEQARLYLEKYREELREFADRQMKPEDMAKALPEILARSGR
jgi:hypothetical protein